MTYPWSHLKYWNSGEWQVVQEKLDDLKAAGMLVNPARKHMFLALSLVPLDKVRVLILGQDPYPESRYATGVAFHVENELPIPPSLDNIFEEYCSDLHYPRPTRGDLRPWCSQGVLLWNAYPSCIAGRAGSNHWEEWTWLTREILTEVYEKNKNCVFIFLGNKAKEFYKYLPPEAETIMTSHPSPLGVNKGFKGSRIFSTTNALLSQMGEEPINWRLPDGTGRLREDAN